MASNTNPGSVGSAPQSFLPSQPQQPQPQPTQPQASIPQQQLSDNDPLVKYQTLLPILKESVVNLIKNTVAILQNISNGQCKQSEMQSLNKCLEDFYNISDQVHHWLVLADTTVGQYLMGMCFSAEVTSSFHQQTQTNTDTDKTPKDVLFYSQFLANAKRHVASASKLRNMLTEFADDLGSW